MKQPFVWIVLSAVAVGAAATVVITHMHEAAAPVAPPPSTAKATTVTKAAAVPIPRIKTRLVRSGGGFAIMEESLGVLRQLSDAPLFTDAGDLAVRAEVEAVEAGFDVIYAIANPTDKSHRLPTLQVPGHDLFARSQWLDVELGPEFRDLTWEPGTEVSTKAVPYPQVLAAPLAVMRDGRFAVGVVLEYPQQQFSGSSKVNFVHEAEAVAWTSQVQLAGDIGPGQSHRYVIHTRYAFPEDWGRALQLSKDALVRMTPEGELASLAVVFAAAQSDLERARAAKLASLAANDDSGITSVGGYDGSGQDGDDSGGGLSSSPIGPAGGGSSGSGSSAVDSDFTLTPTGEMTDGGAPIDAAASGAPEDGSAEGTTPPDSGGDSGGGGGAGGGAGGGQAGEGGGSSGGGDSGGGGSGGGGSGGGGSGGGGGGSGGGGGGGGDSGGGSGGSGGGGGDGGGSEGSGGSSGGGSLPGGPAPVDDGMPDDLPPGTWVRPFPAPAMQVPVTVQPMGSTFSVSSPLLGLLKSPGTQPLWSDGVGLNVQTQLASAANGYDMTYVISNPTAQNVALPALWIEGHHLEPTIDYLHLQFGTKWQTLVVPPFSLGITEQNRYPRTRYAPVAVIRDSQVAIGLSLQYPVLEYKHNVSPEFRHYSYMDDVWAVCAELDGEISPGESRTYKLMVRFALPADWMHTLAPYRDYLWSVYGDRAHYAQDLRPIHGRAMAAMAQIAPDNLRGYITTWEGGQPHRVDLDGWEVEVNYVLNYLAGSGHKRLMMWTASGMYNQYVANNFAPQTLTEWSQPMMATDIEWHRYQDAGIDLGFWHGRSAQIADQWNDPVLDTLDISNPAHAATATNEYALAVQRGATSIGLDSFRMFDLWDAMPWVQNLQSQFPGLRLYAEPQCADILHFHIPFCTDHTNIPTAPLLADYLVPGREVQIVLTGEVSTLAQAYHSYGWGLTVLSFTQSLTASDMQPAVEQAQSGWVLPWDAPVTPVPGGVASSGD